MSRYVFWVTLAAGLVFDAALAMVLAKFAGSSDPVVSFLFFFACVALLPVAIAIWGLVKGVSLFLWPLRSLMEQDYLRVFQSGGFPIRPVYDLDSYLANTVDDETIPVSVRLKAAHLSGQLNGLKVGKPVVIGMLNHLSAEKALHRYQDKHAEWAEKHLNFTPFTASQDRT